MSDDDAQWNHYGMCTDCDGSGMRPDAKSLPCKNCEGTGIDQISIPARQLMTQLARQARTIRRLRALADGYRARATRNGLAASDNCEACHDVGATNGVLEERARIVAALRAKVCANTSTYWDREATALGIVADAIERGEL